MISVAVIDEHSFTRECITKALRDSGDWIDVTSFSACNDCFQNTRMHDLILYHAHESVAHYGNGEARFAHLRRLLEISPVIHFGRRRLPCVEI
jgi:hypothetical protein